MGDLQLFGTAWVIACDHRAVGEVRRSPAPGRRPCNRSSSARIGVRTAGTNRAASRTMTQLGRTSGTIKCARLGGHRTPPPRSLRFDMCDGGVPAGHDVPLPPEINPFLDQGGDI